MSNYKTSEDLGYSQQQLQNAELAEMSAIADATIKFIKNAILNFDIVPRVAIKMKQPTVNPEGVDIEIKQPRSSSNSVDIEIKQPSDRGVGIKDVNSSEIIAEIVEAEIVETDNFASQQLNQKENEYSRLEAEIIEEGEQKRLPSAKKEPETNLQTSSIVEPTSAFNRVEQEKSKLNDAETVMALVQNLYKDGYSSKEINAAIKQGKYYDRVCHKIGPENAAKTIALIVNSAAAKVKVQSEQSQKTITPQQEKESDLDLELER